MSDIILQETSIVHEKKGEISIGTLLMDREGVYPVLRFKNRELTNKDGEIYYIKVIVLGNHRYSGGNEYEITENTLNEYYRVVRGYTFDDIEELSNKILTGELNIEDLASKEDNQTSNSTSLMVLDKNVFKAKLEEIKKMEDKVSLVQALVRQKTEALRSRISGVVSHFNKIITRLNKVIFTLELYAGVQEDIRQIQEGNPADENEPIYLNQLMRFMDEEVGDPTNEGISFDSIDKFDDWLLGYSKHLGCYHYELLLPQQKCVRTMRVRRHASERYTKDRFNNDWEILKEMQTYIMIRNGENIYVIESKMDFSKKLFPDEKELTEIFKLNDEEKIFDSLQEYKNGMILMQGLIDRTTVFGNLIGRVSFLTTESQEKGDVVFQYEMDESRQITDGKETFLDFMNAHPIEVGTRILIWDTTRYHYLSDKGYSNSRFVRWYRSEWSAPATPDTGIYKLILHKTDSYPNGILKFMYTADSRYSWREKKVKTGWIVKPEDSNVVDIDSISHRNIDWINNMLYDRKLRRDYVKVMGALQMIKEYKNKELKKEYPFVQLLMSVTNKSELEVLDAVHWWKTKNKYKRPLEEDDKKAFRMIKKELFKNE